MHQMKTKCHVACNSGALEASVIAGYSGSKKDCYEVGDVIKVSITKVVPNCSIKKGDMKLAMIIQTKRNTKRKGLCFQASRNAVVLLNEDRSLLGTRIDATICKMISDKKILSSVKGVY